MTRLLAAQIALCCVTVTAAFVSLRGLAKAMTMNMGFNPKHAVLTKFELNQSGYSKVAADQFQRQMLEKVSHLPGVQAAGYTDATPLSQDTSTSYVFSQQTTDFRPSNRAFATYDYKVSPGYFVTAETPLLAGRDVSFTDTAKTPRVAVVNQHFASLLFHSDQAVGSYFKDSSGQSILIERYEDGSLESLPPPPSLTTPSLEGVSCLTSGCLAVGSQGIGPQRKALALTITTTSVQRALPPPTPTVTLSAVSCAGPATCTAIGLRGARRPFAIRLVNHSWVALQAPSGLDPVGGISCPGALDCEAVGSRSRPQPQSGLATAAALRDGSSWAAEPIPAPGR